MLSIDLVVAVLLLSLVLQNQQHYAATAFAPPPSASWPPPRSIIVAHTPEGRAGVSLLASSSSSSSSSSSDNQTMTLIEETDNDNTILLTQEEEDELLEENVEFLDDSFSGNSILTDEQLNKLEDAPYSKNGYSLMTGRYSTMLDEPILSRLFQPNRKNQKQEKMQQQQQQHSFPQPPPLATATTTSSSTTTTTTTIPTEQEDDENEDGWSDLRKGNQSLLKYILKLPLRLYDRIFPPETAAVPKSPSSSSSSSSSMSSSIFTSSSFAGTSTTSTPGTLILVRHGESTWNANKTFTGWADADLSERGIREIEHAARLLLEGGFEIDVVFTSRLKRAIRSVWILLQEMNQVYLPVFKSWRLNERMYGALTSLSKTDLAQELGHDLVQEWRSSLKTQPPPTTQDHPYWPGRERKYADLQQSQIPTTESLLDCMNRATPMWENKILYELRNGKTVLVVAHANTLRGLVKKIDNISEQDIQKVAIPTAIPIIYKFDQVQSMKPLSPSMDDDGAKDGQTAFKVDMNGLFLEKPGLLKQALAKEAEWSQQVPGYQRDMQRSGRTPLSPLERSLYKLMAERELNNWAAGQDAGAPELPEDDGSDGNNGLPMQLLSLDSMGKVQQVGGDKSGNDEALSANMVTQPCVTGLPSNVLVPGLGATPIRKDAVIVIIRHGKTEHNKLGLFTGWEDAPLAKDGVEEAKQAGRLLRAHGFEFDVVYTSWLTRAIETAWYVMDEMDCVWLPIIKTWRLNERMYGKLTGLSKLMVKQRHGEKQFKAWRRGYDTPPPKVSSFSQHYPGNDRRYQSGIKDVRYSLRESLIRSIESGRPTIARKLPKTESLKDCMDRTIPFFTEKIVPEAIGKGKRVLISSSENAIRGLLMHLCDIPQDKITGLEIPNGLPIIFDLRSKCVKLLDDGTGRDPLETYNFGSAASYLFRPCQNEDGSPDEECTIQLLDDDSDLSGSWLGSGISAEDQASLDAIKQGTVN